MTTTYVKIEKILVVTLNLFTPYSISKLISELKENKRNDRQPILRRSTVFKCKIAVLCRSVSSTSSGLEDHTPDNDVGLGSFLVEVNHAQWIPTYTQFFYSPREKR